MLRLTAGRRENGSDSISLWLFAQAHQSPLVFLFHLLLILIPYLTSGISDLAGTFTNAKVEILTIKTQRRSF